MEDLRDSIGTVPSSRFPTATAASSMGNAVPRNARRACDEYNKKEIALGNLEKGSNILVECGRIRRAHVLAIDATLAIDHEGNR